MERQQRPAKVVGRARRVHRHDDFLTRLKCVAQEQLQYLSFVSDGLGAVVGRALGMMREGDGRQREEEEQGLFDHRFSRLL